MSLTKNDIEILIDIIDRRMETTISGITYKMYSDIRAKLVEMTPK